MIPRASILACIRVLAGVLACLIGLRLVAHPVAQGAITVAFRPDEVEMAVQVSEEELLVSFAQAPESETDPLAHHGRYLLQHLQVLQGGDVRPARLLSATRTPGAALPAVYRIGVAADGARPLTLRQDVLREFEFAPGNPWEASYVVQVGTGGTPTSGRLLTARDPLTLGWPGGPDVPAGPGAFVSFLGHGWRHILGGHDHLLFLCALVLGARSAWGLVQVVTAFTLAHSSTLALAALGVARPPTRLIESAIAASVVYAALLNLRRGDPAAASTTPSRHAAARRVAMPLAFGLVHGFGFANALGELGLTGSALVAPLVGFNLGVEAGQLVAVAVFLPVAFVLRRTTFYRHGVVPVGSVGIALVAMAWLVDRAFDLRFMPF